MRRSLTSAFLLILTLSSAADPAAPPKSENTTASVANQASVYVRQRKLHDVGDVRVKIGSDGTFGSHWSGDTPDTADENLLRREGEATFEFPAKSHRQHSYIGGLWIAGIRDWDTLASRACAAGSGDLYDFAATGPMVSHMDSAAGYQRFDCLYFDTMASPSRSEPLDMPLGLEVHQTSHAFASPPYDRFVIIEYRIRNISRSTIHRPYVGFFDDCDIYNERATGLTEAGPSDDVSGFIPSRAIAYTIDNNGDPSGDSTWTPTSTISAMGIAPIHFDPLPLDTSFNWWSDPHLGWGPSRFRENFHTRGTPTTPPNAYHVMANEELDYDQLWSTVDQRAEGWNAPFFGSSAVNIANGSDTRFLLSFGFRDLAPNDSIHIVIALAAGDSVHVNPGDLVEYFDPDHPEEYYQRLNFTDLIRNVESARHAWAQDFDLYGAPARITLLSVADDVVRCGWTPAPFYHVTGYRLFRRDLPDGEWVMVAETARDQLNFVTRNLEPGMGYEFAVASLDWNGIEGPRSHPARITVGLPIIAPVLVAKSLNTAVGLNWKIPPSPSELSSPKYLNIFRRMPGEVDVRLLAQIPIRPPPALAAGRRMGDDGLGMLPYGFVDRDIASGVTYTYRATVSNSLGLEGPTSNEITITPMWQDRRGLLILGGDVRSGALVNLERQREFYKSWAAIHGFELIEAGYPSTAYEIARSMSNLSRYQCVVVIAEDAYAYTRIETPEGSIRKYARSGGKCVFILRNHGISNMWWRTYDVDEAVRSLCGVSTVYKESRIQPADFLLQRWLKIEFVRGRSHDPLYPDIEGDSARGWDFEILRDLASRYQTDYAHGYTPVVGALGGLDSLTQILYTYRSAYDTSFFQGKPIAVKRITDSTAAILFNFPLSLMNHAQAWKALTQAVADLGIDTANYNLPSTSLKRAIIEWLYGRSPGKPDPAWDVNQDGVVDIRDAIQGQRW